MCSMPMRKEENCRRSPWRFVCLAAAVVSGGWLVFYGAVQLLALRALEGEAVSIGIIGGADGPTQIFVTTAPPDLWSLVLPLVFFALMLWGFIRTRRR